MSDQNQDIYRKTSKDWKVQPNLKDYQKSRSDFSLGEVEKNEIDWFDNGKINAAYNAVDRHLKTENKNKKALLWEGDKGEKKEYTFQDLAQWTNRYGNYLKSLGVEKGDRVFIFLPRIPELYFVFLGALKIGAVAGTMFSAFYEQALFDRLDNSEARVLFTNKELAPRVTSLKAKLPNLKNIIIVDDDAFIKDVTSQPDTLDILPMDPEDPAYMLYTSGTTGKPKGVVHVHKDIVSQYLSSKYVLDFHPEDRYWCTADPGWVTGVSYTILGNLSNGITTLVYSGRFDADKWYQLLQDYKITVWYTAPTAIRMLMSSGTATVKKYNLSTLRHLLSVGEPLNPEAIRWGLEAFGMPFHDTWWQTETGSIMIANYQCMDIKLGSMGRPFLGITGGIVDEAGVELPAGKEGNLALRPGWPSMMRSIFHNEEKYKSYFINGWYISGDRGWMDKDGYFWFVGRADDVIKTSGERVGPFEVESALIEHPAVIEAGVIGKPDPMRGEIIKAFVVLKDEEKEKAKDEAYATKLKAELGEYVKRHLAGHAYPREISFIDKLPKTRSGKIMRRILKAQELGLPIGDTSTLEEY